MAQNLSLHGVDLRIDAGEKSSQSSAQMDQARQALLRSIIGAKTPQKGNNSIKAWY